MRQRFSGFAFQGPRRFGSVWMKRRGCECIVTERE
nr:hypothetical protein [Sicyoidochytrium minutum DNA virus]